MKVADLFALLGLKPDTASFRAGDRLLTGMAGKVKKLGDSAKIALGVGLANAASEIQQSFTSALDLDSQFSRLEIASSGALSGFQDEVVEASNKHGILQEDLIEGTAQFVSLTGDTESAAAAMDTFGKVNVATGATMQDVAGASAAMSTSMGITADQFEKGFDILAAGGKAGAVEIKDLAKELAKAAPLSAQFAGGKGLGGLAKLGAAFQLVRRGTGSAAETTTQLVALQGAVINKATALEKVKGVKVFNVDAKTGAKTLREFDAIIADIANSELAKDPAKLTKALGSKEAFLAFLQLRDVKGEWQALADETRNAEVISADYATRQASNSAKVRRAWNRMRNAILAVTAVLIEALVLVIDNWKAFVVAFSSLALAAAVQKLITLFTVLKVTSIRAAIASAAAWLASMIPFLLLTIAIAAIILIVEDLWRAFTGGESVFKDLYLAAKKWIGDKLTGVIDDASRKIVDFLGLGDEVDTLAEGLSGAVSAIKSAPPGLSKDELLATGLSSALGIDLGVGENRDQFTGRESNLTNLEQVGPGLFSLPSRTVNATSNVTVNARTDATADDIGASVETAMSRFWDSRIREAAP